MAIPQENYISILQDEVRAGDEVKIGKRWFPIYDAGPTLYVSTLIFPLASLAGTECEYRRKAVPQPHVTSINAAHSTRYVQVPDKFDGYAVEITMKVKE